MSRTMAVMGWIFWTAAGLACVYLACVDAEVAERQVGRLVSWMAANRPNPELLKSSPVLAGLFTGQVMLSLAAAFLLGANAVFLMRLYSMRYGRGRPRKDILFEDEIGTTTVEISALETYLRDALQAEDDIEKVDLTINMPPQDDHPIIIDVRLRMRARENIPATIEKKVKRKTRESFLEVIPMDIAPIVRATVELGSAGAAPRTTVTDGVLRASTRMRVTTPGAAESRRAATLPHVEPETSPTIVPPPSLFRGGEEAEPESPLSLFGGREDAAAQPPPSLFLGQASYSTEEEEDDEEEEEDAAQESSESGG